MYKILFHNFLGILIRWWVYPRNQWKLSHHKWYWFQSMKISNKAILIYLSLKMICYDVSHVLLALTIESLSFSSYMKRVYYLWLAYLKNRARYSLLHLDQVKVPVLELRVGDMMVPELWWQLLSVPSWNIPKLWANEKLFNWNYFWIRLQFNKMFLP